MTRSTQTLPLFFFAAFTTFASAACSSSTGAPEPSSPTDGGSDGSSASPTIVRSSDVRDPAVASDVATAVNANNAFAIDLYTKAAASAHGGNFLTSPLSATLALTMTYAGAEGATATQMASVLHVPSKGPSIFAAQNALSQALNGRAAAAFAADTKTAKEQEQPAPSSSDYEEQIVNSVWGQTGFPWGAPFLSTLAKSYGTGVYVEDFEKNPSGAETAINDWVSTSTGGKIDPLLPANAITKDTRMVLVNAIHLKLPWASPFQTNATAPATFTRGDGTTVQAPFMHQELSAAGYAETSDAQLVSLPLAGNGASVVFVLPKADLATVTASLTAASFNVPLASKDVILSLPKFSLAPPTFSLAKELQALGMTDAFNPKTADFKGICKSPPDGSNLFIADVLQKATLDVAEKGVEAAAATAVLVSGTSVAVQSVSVTIDRPFFVSIVDASGAILFLGQVDDPTSGG
jgi:serpin B